MCPHSVHAELAVATDVGAAAFYASPDLQRWTRVDAASVFSHYRALIALRHRLAVVADGDFERLDVGAPAVFAFRRTLGAQRLLVIANLSSSAVTPHLPEAERDYWRDERPILNNVVGEDRADAALSPWKAKVYTR